MDDLPPLPEPMAALLWEHLQFDVRNRTDAQLEAFCATLRSYAEEAVKQEREACAQECERIYGSDERGAKACAVLIRARSQEGQG